MREIEFRGKCLTTDRWFYGDLHQINEPFLVTWIIDKEVNKQLVDPETVVTVEVCVVDAVGDWVVVVVEDVTLVTTGTITGSVVVSVVGIVVVEIVEGVVESVTVVFGWDDVD